MSWSERLFFLHLPKTAGTSLVSFLEEHFALWEIMPKSFFGKDAPYVRLADARAHRSECERFKLISGHYGFTVWQELFSDFTLMTMLREPRRRIVSLYNDWRTKSEENLLHAPLREREFAAMARELDLATLLAQDHPIIHWFFENGQAKQIAGFVTDEHDPAALLDIATEHLKSCAFVGLQEFFALSLQCIADQLQWPAPERVPNLNTTDERKVSTTLTDEAIEAIDRLNKVDQELYRVGRDMFSRSLTSYVTGLQQRTPRGTVAGRNGNSQTLRVVMDMAQRLQGAGWHDREGVGSSKIWRWTGPGRESTVELPLKPGLDYRLTIRVLSVISQDILDGVHLLANGAPLQVQHCGTEDGEQVVQAVIPAARVCSTGPTTVSILVPRTVTHASVQPETRDFRQKGLAISGIVAEAI